MICICKVVPDFVNSLQDSLNSLQDDLVHELYRAVTYHLCSGRVENFKIAIKSLYSTN